MLPIIPVGTIVAFLAVAFVASTIWIGIRAARESRQQQAARVSAQTEIVRRALAKGRSVAHLDSGKMWRRHNGPPPDDTIWKMQGSAPLAIKAGAGNGAARDAGIDWTLSWRIALRDTTATWDSAPTVWERDTIQGQLLSWRCPSIKTDQPAFNLYHRTNRYDKKPDEITSEADGVLWRRWRLEAKDAVLARRVFNARLCALLQELPVPRASNSLVDERTSISLGPGGLQADLGVEELTPELVDLWIEIGEQMIGGGELH